MRLGIVMSCIVAFAGASAVRADIPGPWGQPPPPHPWGRGAPPPGWDELNQPQKIEAPLVVAPAAGQDRQTRLRLPGSLVKQLQSGGGLVEEAPYGWAPTPTGTVVAGLALPVAAVLGGLWIIRNPKRRWIGGAVTAATAVVIVGVCGCPPQQRVPDTHGTYVERLNPLRVQPDQVLAGEALLEVSEKEDSVYLTVDQGDLAAWAGPAASNAIPDPVPWGTGK